MVVSFIPGSQRLMTVKTIKEVLHVGLKEAKDYVDYEQFVCDTEEQFSTLKSALEEIGCTEFKVL